MTVDEVETSDELRAPFPWFGGKRRVAGIVWPRLGDVSTYNEPFAGSLAVLLARPHTPRVETVNDLDCVVPETRILRSNLTWARASELRVGDTLIGFDEQNGPAREGLRAPTRYRRLARSVVTGTRILEKPCYRLTFDDGTEVVSSADHLWLGGSHRTGGRGWRWVKTENMVCNRQNQRSWVLKVCDVHCMEDSHESGWLGGMLDGEGHIKAGPGLSVSIAQREGPVLDRAERLLNDRGHNTTRVRSTGAVALNVTGGMTALLSLLMRVRPERLIAKLESRLSELSLYGREHRAIGLVKKEFVGHRVVVAIETSSRTFIAEGLASHNCYLANFWRALQADSDGVAYHADGPVNEADLHARHRWLVDHRPEQVMTDPEFYDVRIAGWWVWGQCLWIGSGWCSLTDKRNQNPVEQRKKQRGGDVGVHGKRWAGTGNGQGCGVHRRWQGGGAGGGSGVHAPRLTKQMPRISAEGGSISAVTATPLVESGGLYDYLRALSARLRRVRVCCGDWKRVLTPSVTTYVGICGVFLDPPYSHDMRERCYSEDHDISADVRAWALEHGDDPKFRIALCGYEGEHDMPDTWECVPWKAHGGYSRTERGVANRDRERIWFSPHCLPAELPLFASE